MRHLLLGSLLLAGCFSPHTTERSCGSNEYCPGGEICDVATDQCVPTARTMIFATLAAGSWHTCGIDVERQLWCWGDNTFGALGVGTPSRGSQMVQVGGQWAEVTAGDGFTCAIPFGDRETISCWGRSFAGVTNLPNPGSDVEPQPAYHGLSGSGAVICALTDAGNLACWTRFVSNQDFMIRPVTADQAWIQVAGGGGPSLRHFCAIDAGNDLYCWGIEKEGTLGDGGEADAPRPRPDFRIPGQFDHVWVGPANACASTVAAENQPAQTLCWGKNNLGQAAASGNASVTVPMPARPEAATAVALGNDFSCLAAGTQISCQGTGNDGQLGSGAVKDSRGDQVAGLADAVLMTAGTSHVCALRASGLAYCWGHDGFGQLGHGEPANNFVAVQTGLQKRVSGTGLQHGWYGVSTGARHGCGFDGPGGPLLCWGWNAYGQVDPSQPPQVIGAFQVAPSGQYKAVSAGGHETCAIDMEDKVKCWGEYTHVLDQPVRRVATSFNAACAELRDSPGQIVCWGNQPGAVGVESPNHSSLAASPTANFALAFEGTEPAKLDVNGIYANPPAGFEPLGFAPFSVPGQLSMGDQHQCATDLAGGRLFCRGDDSVGQLGNGSEAGGNQPVELIAPESSWRGVASGRFFSCSVSGRDAYCWGDNQLGQAGSPVQDSDFLPSPTQVEGLTISATDEDPEPIHAGASFACSVQDGVLFCWGDNANGQLGNGRSGSSTPTMVIPRQP